MSRWIFVLEERTVVTFFTPRPRMNSCLSKRMSFSRPSSLSFTSPDAEEAILAVGTWYPVFQSVLVERQSWLMGFVRVITRLMNLIPPNSHEAPFYAVLNHGFILVLSGVETQVSCSTSLRGAWMSPLGSTPSLLPGFGINIRGLFLPRDAHLLAFMQQTLVPSDAAGALGAHCLLSNKNHFPLDSLPPANMSCMVFLRQMTLHLALKNTHFLPSG